MSLTWFSKSGKKQKLLLGDFPEGPVANTPSSQRRDPGSIRGRIPNAATNSSHTAAERSQLLMLQLLIKDLPAGNQGWGNMLGGTPSTESHTDSAAAERTSTMQNWA